MIGAEGQLTDERRAGPTNRSGAKSERAGQGSSTYELLVSTSTGNFWAKPHARRPCPGAYVRTGLAPELPDTLEPLTSIRYPQPGIYGRTLVGSPITPALTGPSRTPQGTSTTPLLANRSQRVRPRPANLQSKAPRRKGPNKCGREDSSGLACQRTAQLAVLRLPLHFRTRGGVGAEVEGGPPGRELCMDVRSGAGEPL